MVRYGGPRFEFFFTHQFLNNEQVIRKEDAQRVAFIKQLRKKAAEEEQAGRAAREQVLENELQRAEEAEAAKRYAVELIEAKKRLKAKKQNRINELAMPVVRDTKRYGGGTSGWVMYPSSKGVSLPQGRSGAKYMPGVDRHRIVPPPPAPDAHPPWIGSGTAWKDTETKEKEGSRYYFPKSKRDASEANDRNKYVNGIERYHTGHGRKAIETEEKEENGVGADAVRLPASLNHSTEETERPPSVFSHASSNGPIKALGTKHMNATTTKRETQEHLARYGGALVPPRQFKRSVTPFDNMTLPELSARLVRMQQRMRV